MALLSWLPPGTPHDVLASPMSTGVFPLILAGRPFWPLSTQKDLRSHPIRAVVTVGLWYPWASGTSGTGKKNWTIRVEILLLKTPNFF